MKVEIMDSIKKFKNLEPKSTEISEEDWHKLIDFVKEAFVPKNTIIDDRPFEYNDFKSHLIITKKCFLTLNDILCELSSTGFCKFNSSLRYQFVYTIILLCGEHNSKQLWTDNDSIISAHKVLNRVLCITGTETLYQFLIQSASDEKLHCHNLFANLIQKLDKESWKYYPASVACFTWLLFQIKIPYMKHFTNFVLPISLNLIDDYVVENKVLGLNCMLHIISNISKTELNWCIQLKLLYEIFQRFLYYREAQLIVPLIKCILQVSEKLETGYSTINWKWSFIDDVLNILLPIMEHESNVDLKNAYCTSLRLILEFLGPHVSQWSAKMLPVIEEYIKFSSNCYEALNILNIFIKKCWPVIPKYRNRIIFIACKVLHKSDDQKCLQAAEQTLSLLQKVLSKYNITIPISIEDIKKRRMSEL